LVCLPEKTRLPARVSNCLESRVLWADFDNKTLSEVKGATEKLKPNIIISSGHGFHTYWLLDKAYTPKDILPVFKGIKQGYRHIRY